MRAGGTAGYLLDRAGNKGMLGGTYRYISGYMLDTARYMVGVTAGYMLGTAGYMGLGLGLGGLNLTIFEVISDAIFLEGVPKLYSSYSISSIYNEC